MLFIVINIKAELLTISSALSEILLMANRNLCAVLCTMILKLNMGLIKFNFSNFIAFFKICRSQERLDYAIHNHIQQLEDLKTSLQTKWARIKGKGSKAVSNTKPSSSNSHSWVANVSEVNLFSFAKQNA